MKIVRPVAAMDTMIKVIQITILANIRRSVRINPDKP